MYSSIYFRGRDSISNKKSKSRKKMLEEVPVDLDSDSNTDKPIENSPTTTDVCMVGRDLKEFVAANVSFCIRRLDLSFNQLTKIHGLKNCKNTLEELILDNNEMTYLTLPAKFPKLHTISCNNNQLMNLKSLMWDLSTQSPNLRFLSLLGNPICPYRLSFWDFHKEEDDYEKYRITVIAHLKNSLRFLDHRPVSPEELEAASMPSEETNIAPSPLPQTRLKQVGRTGRRKYKYLGKHSEGNRFIRDSDL